MKWNFILISCLIFSTSIFAQENKINNQDLSSYFPKPKVDKRIELLSIVFRLAGNREFNSEDFKSYTQDIHNYFDKFKDHPLISFASKLRMEKGVSYDAVIKMAFHINLPPEFKPKVEFVDEIPEKRWGKDNALKFLELLKDFYIASDFEKFYNEHSELYTIAEERFLPVYKTLNIYWYNQYYGVKPEGSFNVIIGVGNGGGNFGGKLFIRIIKKKLMRLWEPGILIALTSRYIKLRIIYRHLYMNSIILT